MCVRACVCRYAMTVHKAQGNEWPAVVVVAHPSHYVMLTRGLLYTAVSRARELCVMMATKKVGCAPPPPCVTLEFMQRTSVPARACGALTRVMLFCWYVWLLLLLLVSTRACGWAGGTHRQALAIGAKTTRDQERNTLLVQRLASVHNTMSGTGMPTPTPPPFVEDGMWRRWGLEQALEAALQHSLG